MLFLGIYASNELLSQNLIINDSFELEGPENGFIADGARYNNITQPNTGTAACVDFALNDVALFPAVVSGLLLRLVTKTKISKELFRDVIFANLESSKTTFQQGITSGFFARFEERKEKISYCNYDIKIFVYICRLKK